jgi:4'-phosphopantetheinyl transferase
VVLENDPIMMSVCRKTNVAWIKPDEIHIWWTRTDSPAWDPSRMASLVSDDEKARADRFHFSRDQRRFIMVHGILRTILGYYLERRPVGLKFLNSPKGKPRLDDAGAGVKLCFNLSHSRNLAVFGMALNRQIGVDVEHIRPFSNIASIAGRYFSESERNAILDAPSNERDRMFFLYWTIKEAYLKATGEGLSGLKEIRTSGDVIGAHPSNPLVIADDSNQLWTVCPIHTASGYAAAFAVEGNSVVNPILRGCPPGLR